MGQAWGTTTCCTGGSREASRPCIYEHTVLEYQKQCKQLSSQKGTATLRVGRIETATRITTCNGPVFTDIQTSILALPPFRMVKLYFTTMDISPGSWKYYGIPSFTTYHHYPPLQEYMAAVYLAGDITLLTFNELYALRVEPAGVACRTQRCWLIFKNLD